MARHIAPDFVRHDPGLPFEVRGPQGVTQLHDALLPAFPDMELPLQDFIAEGEKVLVRLRVKGTHTGPFGDMAATGRKIDIGRSICSRFATACSLSTGHCSTTWAC